MSYKKSEKGQALVLIALAAVGLFGFTALAVDGSRVFSDRRHAQNAADTSALAAALKRVRAEGNPPNVAAAEAAAKLEGLARAISNGYDTDADSIVEINFCNESGITCQGLPAGAVLSEYVRVRITSTIQTTFARIIGRREVTSVVDAVARAAPSELEPINDGAALAALSPDDPDAMNGQGNFTLDIINSGVFVNSSASGGDCAMQVNGSAGTYSVDTSFSVVGNFGNGGNGNADCQNGNVNLDGNVQPASPIDYPPEIDIPTPSITCPPAVNGSRVGDTYLPGNYNAQENINGGNITFASGDYCFHAGVKVTNANIQVENNVRILLTAGEFQFNGGTFKCPGPDANTLVHIVDGGTGMHFNGNASIECNGVTFFATTGDVSWNGNVANTLIAPSGGPYAHVLIYLPHGNDSPLKINGNSDNQLAGSIIAVSSPIEVFGNSGTFSLSSQITGYTVDLGGNGLIQIDYDPDDQFQQMDPSNIQLTE